MTGQRVYPDAEGKLGLGPGDFGLDPSDRHWYARPPDTEDCPWMTGDLSNHDVEEHGDGSITVKPSLLITTTIDGQARTWHGYLTGGVWSTC